MDHGKGLGRDPARTNQGSAKDHQDRRAALPAPGGCRKPAGPRSTVPRSIAVGVSYAQGRVGGDTTMDRIRVRGGKKLSGVVEISGSKNSTLPILTAVLMVDGPVLIH